MGVIDYQVTAEDKAIFDRDGYWISPKLIDDETIERLRKAHDRIWDRDFDGDGFSMNPLPPKKKLAIRKCENGWWINDEVHAFVTDENLGKIAADILGEDEIRLWHDQVIYKPGSAGEDTNLGNVGWHQDYGYWRCTSTTNMVTVWVALQDTVVENGAMKTILGSHKWGEVEGSDTFFEQDMEKLREKFAQQDWVEEPCILKAGQASFHHSLTFHGSGPNVTSDPRLSIVAHLMPGHTSYHKGRANHDNIKFLGPRPYNGQPFNNEYFPLLYSKKG
ncbi:phytanoyl-CoA dioxygenase family protein [Bacillaceae bacterium SIJ1]|uniref:phytanoyl-CoA dioxygenase family protein n=1 Tax=Litoribacterium kuwaitense TaxID=1398745 RepID=UPI0013ED2A6C|nr:phytanoyl-CoA dioxygenase family protein [Litoribacterium kuwaitense]NGP46375.1 phytanoyl-CoA dioxygenase family protein [Litoribacterium kuwaitense]